MKSKGYTTKQLGDAGEMLIAAELTLHDTPALKAPDFWPGCDVIAQPRDGRGPQRISVKTRTDAPGQIGYDDRDEFDWLAIIILPNTEHGRRRFFIVPRAVTDERGLIKNRHWRNDPTRHSGRSLYVKAVCKKPSEHRHGVADYEDNFDLNPEPST